MKTRTLIIEDQDAVAVAIEHQLQQTRYHGQADICRNATMALSRISAARKDPYDLILCDYNLGECTDGQQLLEYLRSEHLIPRKTAFIMLTAEASYARVASAVELAPDAYLLKPFTLDGLAQRVEYAMDKRAALKAPCAFLDLDQPDYPAAIKACNAIILEGKRFSLDGLKLKAECLIHQAQWGEAAAVYDKIIAWRPTPWAEVGRARTLRLMGHPGLADKKLLHTIEEFPQFVAAYDELAALAEENDDPKLAQEILEKAHAIVPSNRRTRGLGLLALQNGDLDKAAEFLKIVTERDRYGLKRSTEDFFALARAQRSLKRPEHAMATLDSLKDHFPETRPLTVRKMAAEALVLFAANRPFDAKKKVRDALELRHEQMEPRTQLELAEACYVCGERNQAEKLFVHVAENWQEDSKVFKQVKETMSRVGLGEAGNDLLAESTRELIKINNTAAAQIKKGEFEQAVNNMEKVAKRLLHHATVQANYVQSILLWVEHNCPKNIKDLPIHSKPRKYIATAREHLRQLASIDDKHPRLSSLQRLFAKLTGETQATHDVENFDASQEPASMESGG